MPIARSQQIDLSVTPYYHCHVRCVRRGFLCGFDKYSHRNYDHRKQWIADRLDVLSEIFAIDICAYAVMSNHYHVVLHVNHDKAKAWSDAEVIKRWGQLSNTKEVSVEQVQAWRSRLSDISWFMRYMNEKIARMANKEDDCTGRFWEGRFKSQALVDEGALLTCMAYVDLNPVRSGKAKTLQDSGHTSIHRRIENKPHNLMVFQSKKDTQKDSEALPFSFEDYLSLVDWTGRIIRDDKKGFIASDVPPLVRKMNLNSENWVKNVTRYKNRFKQVVGRFEDLKHWADKIGQFWFQGMNNIHLLYSS